MSTQHTRLLSPIDQSEFLQLNSRLIDDLKYFMARITGCWHRKLSRPFTRGKQTFRVCIRCGMYRDFDLQDWKSTGRFYSPSIERRNGI
jgi:hypothetical protein